MEQGDKFEILWGTQLLCRWAHKIYGGSPQSSQLAKTMTSAASPNEHVHFAHDEVILIIVFGSNNQFIEIKDGFAKSAPPLATTTHRL